MSQSYTPNLIELLRATIQDVGRSFSVQEDHPYLHRYRTILSHRLADLERDMASEFFEAATEPVVERSGWQMES